MKFPFKEYVNPKVESKVKWLTGSFLLIMIIPSIFLLIAIIKESNFKSNAKVFVESVIDKTDEDFRFDVIYKYEGENPTIEIDVTNGFVSAELEKSWKNQMSSYNLGEEVELKIYQGEDIDIKLRQLKDEIATSSGDGSVQYLVKEKEKELQTLEEKYTFYKRLTENYQKREFTLERLSKNFEIDYPQIKKFSVLRGLESNFEQVDTVYTVLVNWRAGTDSTYKDSINQLISKKVLIELETAHGLTPEKLNVLGY